MSVGFINHARLAFNRDARGSSDVQDSNDAKQKNQIEVVGDKMLWHVVELPEKIVRWMKDPKVITVALTALAMLAVQFAFYPVSTYFATKTVVVFVVNHFPLSTAKVVAYALTMLGVLGMGVRTYGRFENKSLMDHFYASHGFRLDARGDLVANS